MTQWCVLMAEKDTRCRRSARKSQCKRGLKSARIELSSRSKCQYFVARFKDDGLPYSVHSIFCIPISRIIARRSRSKEWREIGRSFAPLWCIFGNKLRDIFRDEDTEGTYVVPTIDFRAQVLNVYDRRSGLGKPVFRFAPTGAGHWYCISPCVSVDILQQIVSEASAAAKNRPTDVRRQPVRLLAVSPLGESRRFPFFAVSSLCCRRRSLNDFERHDRDGLRGPSSLAGR